MDAWTVTSRSAQQTRKWGVNLGKLLQGGEIIGLVGELGTGKTCFVRGLAEGAEVKRRLGFAAPPLRSSMSITAACPFITSISTASPASASAKI